MKKGGTEPKQRPTVGNYKAPWYPGVRRLNFVCINCRRSKKAASSVACGQCGNAMINAGERIRVPVRRDKAAWRKLGERLKR